MHSREFVHLDIKLDNILLDNNFNIKLADLGIALEVKGTSGYITQRRGTPKYMGPEVQRASSKAPYDVYKADIYSLGVCLHLLLFGTYPDTTFYDETIDQDTGTGESSYEQNDSKMKDYCISKLRKGVSADCRALLQAMLHKDPTKRPSIIEIWNSSWLIQKFQDHIGSEVYQEMNTRKNYIVESKNEEMDFEF